MNNFTTSLIPDMTGKTVLITGGNSGIGYQTALVLAQKGADVVISCRSKKNADEAIAKIKKICPTAKISAVTFDLADLNSVRSFVDSCTLPKIDILINNAGVMNIPTRTLTKDGHEMHFGVNHLGHFALTTGLIPLLKKSEAPRVICVSALVAYQNVFDIKNLQSEVSYKPMKAYAQSKLSNVLFANELGRREPNIVSVALQPGSAMTNLQQHTPKAFAGIAKFLMRFAGQSVEDCALPSLYTATQPNVKTGMFFGPTGKLNKGSAGQRGMPKLAEDTTLAKKLWEVSEQLISQSVKGVAV
jgi:NAD(P)-dependent dehydrogenase (short-subunit alcohol dehydrogenase family)